MLPLRMKQTSNTERIVGMQSRSRSLPSTLREHSSRSSSAIRRSRRRRPTRVDTETGEFYTRRCNSTPTPDTIHTLTEIISPIFSICCLLCVQLDGAVENNNNSFYGINVPMFEHVIFYLIGLVRTCDESRGNKHYFIDVQNYDLRTPLRLFARLLTLHYWSVE